MAYEYKVISSPVGNLKLVASQKALAAILWEKENPRRVPLGTMIEAPANKLLLETERQLGAYFGRKLKRFTVPLQLAAKIRAELPLGFEQELVPRPPPHPRSEKHTSAL